MMRFFIAVGLTAMVWGSVYTLSANIAQEGSVTAVAPDMVARADTVTTPPAPIDARRFANRP